MKQGTTGARAPLYAASGGPATAPDGEKAAGIHMAEIAFLLNGTPVRVADEPPTRTLLDWLRETRGLTGTKEGCNEGDCGACTVMVTDAGGRQGAERLHPVPAATARQGGAHGRGDRGTRRARCTRCSRRWSIITAAQCGFCTPGFVVSMAAGASERAAPTMTTCWRATSAAAPAMRPSSRAARGGGSRAGARLDDRTRLHLGRNILGGCRGRGQPPALSARAHADDLARLVCRHTPTPR